MTNCKNTHGVLDYAQFERITINRRPWPDLDETGRGWIGEAKCCGTSITCIKPLEVSLRSCEICGSTSCVIPESPFCIMEQHLHRFRKPSHRPPCHREQRIENGRKIPIPLLDGVRHAAFPEPRS